MSEQTERARAEFCQRLAQSAEWLALTTELQDALIGKWQRAETPEARDRIWYQLRALQDITQAIHLGGQRAAFTEAQRTALSGPS